MILSDKEILVEIENKNIIIEPYDRKHLGTNSYDVHLSPYLAIYEDETLDAKQHNKIKEILIPEEGIVLQPGTLYLGATLEYTETHKQVPFLRRKIKHGSFGDRYTCYRRKRRCRLL
jgi:dCTP deaminase